MNTVIDCVELPSRNGFDIYATVVPDYESKPLDHDGLTAKQLHAWQHDDWEYVGLVVTASRAGVPLGSGSIWGVQRGLIPCGDDEHTEYVDPLRDMDGSLNAYADELIADAIDNATTTLNQICNHK